jgi:hypothetical protein
LMIDVIQGWRRKMRGLPLANFSCPYGAALRTRLRRAVRTMGVRAPLPAKPGSARLSTELVLSSA